MNLLLDTHVWIWSQEQPDALTESVRDLLRKDNQLWISTASSLELARLKSARWITPKLSLPQWIQESLATLRSGTITISHDIAVEAYALPEPFHRDPIDRILVATARLLNLQFVTADKKILKYPHVVTIPAQ